MSSMHAKPARIGVCSNESLVSLQRSCLERKLTRALANLVAVQDSKSSMAGSLETSMT